MQGHVTVDAVEERCVLVGVITSETSEEVAQEHLDELEFLAETAGAITVEKFFQKLPYPNPRTYVGTGKLEEIKQYMKALDIELIIFDDELSPSQLRNIERELDCKVLDRTILILDIFASRARTFHAKTQVELAQLQYMLPRLTRMWTHLERQKGGIGLRGPGESQIETDRRIIQQRIALMKERLREIDKQMTVQRSNRGQLVRVALVGYTNVGKSTIMNMMSKSDVFAENKLFATVDSTVRKVVWEGIPFLLTDTVGFIRKLPTLLIESFKSTLDEVREADVLLHVIDISHPNFEEQIEVVQGILNEMGIGDKPTILVFNKIDLFPVEDIFFEGSEVGIDGEPALSKMDRVTAFLNNTHWKTNTPKTVFISAEQRSNLAELRETIMDMIKDKHQQIFPNWLEGNHLMGHSDGYTPE